MDGIAEENIISYFVHILMLLGCCLPWLQRQLVPNDENVTQRQSAAEYTNRASPKLYGNMGWTGP